MEIYRLDGQLMNWLFKINDKIICLSVISIISVFNPIIGYSSRIILDMDDVTVKRNCGKALFRSDDR